jgi:hypothetical protein
MNYRRSYCAAAFLALGAGACERRQVLEIVAAAPLTTHYLPDFETVRDSLHGFATSNHLLVFNPGTRPATAVVTILFEDREPTAFSLSIPKQAVLETNAGQWPVKANERFALVVESDEPVVAQATIGWTNTLNDYRPTARAKDGGGPRETALSYVSHHALATHAMIADGIVLESPRLFIRESEWAVIANPSADTAHVTISAGLSLLRRVHTLAVPPRRVRAILMDSVVPANTHYGAVIESDVAIASNWRRTVRWLDRPDLMAFWSVPLVGLKSALAQ